MAQPSKILYIITQSELGGASRYVFDLALAMKTKGHEVEIAAGGDGELFHKAIDHEITIHKLQHLAREIRPLEDIKGYQEIKKLINNTQPDIIHLNSTKAGVLGSLAVKKSQVKKVIYTVHGFVFNETLPWWKKNLYKLAEKLSSKHKDKIICVSEFDKQSGLKNKIAPANKFITVHNGIKKPDLLDTTTAREALKIPANKIIVGTVANFYATKGLEYLIRAADLVVQKNPEILFMVLGDGDLKKDLGELISKNNLNKNFILPGAKQNAERYLKAFDLYVCSSTKEGLPYSIIEAMSAELPIISTNVGGIPEIINDKNGILVESKKPQALAQGIIKLLEDENLAIRLAKQARQDAEAKFSLDKMIIETEKVYWQ